MGISTVINLLGWGLLLFCLLLGGLIGLIRGFKKSLVYLISAVIMFLVFWILSYPIANALVNTNIQGMVSGYESCSTVEELIIEMLKAQDPSLAANEAIIATGVSLVVMVIRIVVLIILLIVGRLIWSIITWILWLTVFRGKKEEYKAKPRRHLLGGAVGLGRGLISFIILFVPISGFLSVFTKSVDVAILASTKEVKTEEVANVTFTYANVEVDNETALLLEFSQGIKGCFPIQAGAVISQPISDTLLSFKCGKGKSRENIVFRKEIVNVLDLSIYVFDNFSGEEMNVNGEVINKTFKYISKSDLLSSAIPMALDVGLNMQDVKDLIGQAGVDYSLNIEELYDVDWKKQINNLGVVASDLADLFDSVNDKIEEAKNGVDLAMVVLNSDDTLVSDVFTDLSNVDVLMDLIPIGVDYALNKDEVKQFVPEDFAFDYGDQAPRDWWKNEVANLGNMINGMKSLEITEIPTKDVDGNQTVDIPALLGLITNDDDKLDGFVSSITSSRLVTTMLPIGFDYGMNELDKNNSGESYKELFNYTNMTADEWKSDFKDLLYIANDLYESKVLELKNETKFVDLNYESLNRLTTKALTLKLIDGNQEKVFTRLVSFIPADSMPVDLANLDFSEVTDWKSEGSALVYTIKEAAPIIDSMNSGEELTLQTLDTKALDGAIDKATDSKIAVQLIPSIVQGVFDSVDVAGSLGLTERYVIPEITDWKKEGKALVNVVDGIKDCSDLALGVMRLNPDILLASKMITDLSVLTVSSLNQREGLDILVIPYDRNASEWYDVYTNDVLTTKGELRLALDAISVLLADAKSFDELKNTVSIKKITELSESNVDTLLASEIIYQTSSKLLLDQTAGTLVAIPNEAKDGSLIKKEELKKAIVGVNELGVVAENGSINASASAISNVTDKTLDSMILRATISNVIYQNKTEDLVIPNDIYDNTITFGESMALLKNEILALKEGLVDLNLIVNDTIDTEKLNAGLIKTIASPSFNFEGVFGTDSDLTKGSAIIRYSVTKMMKANVSEISPFAYINNDSRRSIKPSEIKALCNACDKLELINSSNEFVTPGLGIVNKIGALSDDEFNGLFDSVILHQILSDEIIKNTSITIPLIEDVVFDRTENCYTDKEEAITKRFVKKAELHELSKAVYENELVQGDELAANDITLVNKLYVKDDDTKIINACKSYIIRYTISKMVIEEKYIYCPIEIIGVDSGDDFSRINIDDGTTYRFVRVQEICNLFDTVMTLELIGEDENGSYIQLVGLNDLINNRISNETASRITSPEHGSMIFQATISDSLSKQPALNITDDLKVSTTRISAEPDVPLIIASMGDIYGMLNVGLQLKEQGYDYKNLSYDNLMSIDKNALNDLLLSSRIMTTSLSKIIDKALSSSQINGISLVKGYGEYYTPQYTTYDEFADYYDIKRELYYLLNVTNEYGDFVFTPGKTIDIASPLNALNASSILRPSMNGIVVKVLDDSLRRMELLGESEAGTYDTVTTKDDWTQEIIKLQNIVKYSNKIMNDEGFKTSGLSGIDFAVDKQSDNSDTPSQLGLMLDEMNSSTICSSVLSKCLTNFNSKLPSGVTITAPVSPQTYSDKIEEIRATCKSLREAGLY